MAAETAKQATDPGAAAGSTPAVSCRALVVAGLHVDVYGLSELPAGAAAVSCLWLHHPRLKSKGDMAETAQRVLSAYSARRQQHRGLIAVAFDQRNHGTRMADPRANQSWKKGNPTHAQDMFGMVSGMMMDTIHLIDSLEGYLFGAGGGPGARTGGAGGAGRQINQHLVLGVSLGGHSAWQLLFAEPRVTAGVIVIGCPDYMRLLEGRAGRSKLPTAASFMGSKDFPKSLISACRKYDPKGILFGAGDVASAPTTTVEQGRLRPLLDSRIRGKRFQVLSGGADKLVPYSAAKPFLDFFKDAVAMWYQDGGVYVEDNVYSDAGHEFSAEMMKDAVRFIVDTVSSADESDRVVSAKM